MPSLRKRVSSYFRQLSFHNEPREKRHNFIENTFINKYLQGQITLKDGPPIIYGKNPTDLPNYDLGTYQTGSNTIVGCYTGPNGGLTTVERSEKHLQVLDQDIDFIDTQDEVAGEQNSPVPLLKSPNRNSDVPLDNTTMVIKVAGQEYYVTNRKRNHPQCKSHSMGSLSDFTEQEIEKTKKLEDDSGDGDRQCDRICDSNGSREEEEEAEEKTVPEIETNFPLGKSKSEGNPFNHCARQGKIKRLVQRPTADDPNERRGNPVAANDKNLPQEWSQKTEHIFGISDSLYDKNLITKTKNGDPIADCFGIISRNDSAILAVADGVNWGEKASIAAKSAIHGCLHYLNKTIFLDTKPFDNLVKAEEGSTKSETPIHESRINNTREVFICLLRAFNCAHDLILENKGMLTTLTVAVILPLKQSNVKKSEGVSESTERRNKVNSLKRDGVENYICCVCNVGDTLAYVYSQKYGVRELTKGSHDINCNRDMRDALGALGPVDGINPELSNLTLSITTIQKGDIVLVASDGLTDNFDPNVCKFTVNSEPMKPRKVTTTQVNKPVQRIQQKVPAKPPRKLNNPTSEDKKPPPTQPSGSSESPLVAQFLKQNSLEETPKPSQTQLGIPPPPSQKNPKKPVKALTSRPVQRTHSDRSNQPPKRPQTPNPPTETKYNFLRSKTSLDLRAKTIIRNQDGMPYVTPLQRYELTLLMIEDILKRGISGKENQCVTAKKLCENLISFTVSITNAKRRTLEDNDLYFDTQNGLLVEVSHHEKKLRRKRGLERVQNLPGKLDHVTVVACNVGNTAISFN